MAIRWCSAYLRGCRRWAVIPTALATKLGHDQVPACGASLDYLMEVFPLTEVLAMVLSGDGTCAEGKWSLLGITIPGWTLLGFIGLGSVMTWQILRPLPEGS